jgi:predicted DNA-binding transcriptional regulator AlpA
MADRKSWTERPACETLENITLRALDASATKSTANQSNGFRMRSEVANATLRDPSCGVRASNATKIDATHSAAEGGHGAPSNDLDDVIFLRLPEVKALTGLSKSSLYAMIRERSFPAPVRLGTRAVAWVKSEVRQWAVDRVHAPR